MKNRRMLTLLILAALLLSGVIVTAQPANLAACVDAFDAQADYFPEKVTVEHSSVWSVEYHNHYKVVTIETPWPGAGADDAFQYVLVQCGTPTPEGYDSAQVIEVPAGELIAMSTTYLPHITDLGLTDQLAGLDSFSILFASNPTVIDLVESGAIADVGGGANVNVEVVLDIDPGLVLTYGSGSPDFDVHPVLLQAGIPVVVASDYVETSPLGTAEWVKFVALFYNEEAAANALYAERTAEYQRLAALTADLPDDEKPLILWNSYTSFGDAWFIPGGRSYAAQLLRDAGGVPILSDDPEATEATGGVPYAFEVVYDAGLNADFWVPQAYGVNTLDDLISQDSRYADLGPVQNNTVYDISARLNINGGNDYFETGAANPQIILADLIRIFHPDLLPDHELYFFKQLE